MQNLKDFTPADSMLKMAKGGSAKKKKKFPDMSGDGKVTMKDIEKIAKEKMVDLNAIDLNGAVNIVKGSAVSMGMEVII